MNPLQYPCDMDARYSRQIPVIGQAAQELLGIKKIGIVGLGALGSHASNIIVRMGANDIVIIDRDIVELHNLHRCALYTESDVGNPKAYAAFSHLTAINNELSCSYHICDIHESMHLLDNCDIVIECLDSIEARIVLGRYLKEKNIPWVHGAGIREYGEIKAFNQNECYECFIKGKESYESCSVDGVHPSIIAIVSSLQCHAAVKLLSGQHNNNLLRLNINSMSLRTINVDATCNNSGHAKELSIHKSCAKNVFRLTLKKDDYNALMQNKQIASSIKKESFYRDGSIIIADDMRMIIQSESEDDAMSQLREFLSNNI
jgi:molybdopterin-synthase adenylyltransferase